MTPKNLQKQKSIFTFFYLKISRILILLDVKVVSSECSALLLLSPLLQLIGLNLICLGWLTGLVSTCFFKNLVQKRGTRQLPRTASSPPIPPRVGWSHCGVLSSKYTTSTKAGEVKKSKPQISLK